MCLVPVPKADVKGVTDDVLIVVTVVGISHHQSWVWCHGGH